MKKILLILLFISTCLSVQSQQIDTAFVQAAADLYQPKANKAGVAISVTAPLPIFRKADNKIAFNKAIARQATIDSASQIRTDLVNSINSVSTSKQAQIDNLNSLMPLKANVSSVEDTYAKKSDLSVGAKNTYYVDNNVWKSTGQSRSGAAYTAQLEAAKRGSVIYT